jgi:CRISPR-associated endonuclease Cas1/group II intron reverse transcriptase/maturase
MTIADHPLSLFTWHRLRAELVCLRVVPSMSAHPLAVFQAIVKGVSASLNGDTPPGEDGPPLFFTVHNKRHTSRLNEGGRITVDIVFGKAPSGYAEQWREAFATYLADPQTGKNFDLAALSPLEERTLAKLYEEHPDFPEDGEICLDFMTPLPFSPDRAKHRTSLSPSKFVQSLQNRIVRLFGSCPSYRHSEDDWYLLPHFWNYTEIRNPSHSQPGNTQYVNGCAGRLYLRGKFTNLLPMLLMGGELHAGGKLGYGLGNYTLAAASPPWFCKAFPHKKALLATVRDVLERYDNAAESLAQTEPYPFNDEKFVEGLCVELSEGRYQPTPATAFTIAKKNGAERIIEQLRFRDLIVQQYILGLITDTFDRIFEEESIGFRKGVSREKAADLIKQALDDGYSHVLESDIEDFFPSVDHHLLDETLARNLPLGDEPFRRLIMSCVRTDSILNGKLVERTKGLAQGSPLSPILANLFLDAFDERVKSWGLRVIRFADDFVILARSREEAETALCRTEEMLDGLGLCLNKEKTSIHHISEGLRFLGLSFEGGEAHDVSTPDTGQVKKPLYIVEPFTFLALNGESIEIIKQKHVMESIPLRRISEIMVMEKATFSTALVRKCADFRVPLTLTLNSGYFVATVKPDSKQYFDTAYLQAQRYYAMSETEHLLIAKEFAAGKIANYISLIRQRYEAGLNHFIDELERVIERIRLAADDNQVRGFEGSAAKKLYAHFNGVIKFPAFQMKRRDRNEPDRINSLLNFGYYLLFSRINATVRASGLNPYLGFLHSSHDNYESLVCDIEELFRSHIDRLVLRCINKEIIKEGNFVQKEKDKRLVLDKDATRAYVAQFEAELERRTTKGEMTLKQEIYRQVQGVKRFMTEEKGALELYRWKV